MKKKLTSLSLGLLLGASAAFAAETIYTAPSFFDENGGYFGPDCDQTNYSGAYYTGDYTSPFKTFLGKTDAEIQEKMDQLWNHYFKGDNNSKVYYDNGNEAYIKDINNNDVRSEGMSYGMMIAVQTNHKEEFDKLWNWAKNHMWHKSGDWDGYFAWKRGDNGQGGDDNCAPDGEMYFMMSLLFAANRWGDSQYMDDAQYILDKMWSNYNHQLFNTSSYIITFQPTNGNNTWSDPSYDLPAYVDLFARWSKTHTDKWTAATKATRDHLYKSSNTSSGLFSDYNNFDGTPHAVSFNNDATRYMYDAMRCAMNFGMDYYLFGSDAKREEEMAKRIIDFFEKDGYQHARFNWDGSNPSESYTLGETGANAVAAMALANNPSYEKAIKTNLEKAWNASLMTGQYRYYDGLVHYLSMLHLSGTFKIWKPKPTVEKKTVEGTEYNGVTYDKETTINAFEGCKLYEVTITGKQSAPVVDAAIAITSVKAMNAARVWSTNSAIVIENVAAGTNFSVTDMNGRVMMKSKVSSASHEIPMSNKGAFLVMVGNKTFKVIK
ncbi:Endo-1,4-beta-D-glucanase Y [Fibrobacter sp. UWH9]|uniref:glycosyl hydrolase family 8 n=1 Tax=unclassified Fibrobacter TaxID=2634177 RepID=UPI0009171FA9|nr:MULTISPECIES: glycosyl hydrolase family 8 [unclassified Fibrobacter]OWV16559.1 glycoside hydrolase [Fibrobacter sp. UWH1]SHH16120.1 Endo-1,4-beta-D-glucanase Y [Fibrobacter sp. UWH9]SHL48049.1 Endo-1,4-beta-D-glucanase Y [Fibrobacter sp. UWH6]